uniref:Uncharacterized protein n=1 Tax=Sichuan mosquito picorna-like virus TaxID=2863998 RepID=A0A8K1HKM1_9VIRU|nr:hypothetical protein [Sichuan mosquito picorna-like virus]
MFTTIRNFFIRPKTNKIAVTGPEPRTFRVVLKVPNVVQYAVSARTTQDLYDVIRYHAYTLPDSRLYSVEHVVNLFTLYYHNKPLSKKNVALEAYNIRDNETIVMLYHGLLGGSKMLRVEDIVLPTYTHIQECEQMVIKKAPLVLQSQPETLPESVISYYLMKQLEGKSIDPEFVPKLMEDIMFFIKHLCKAKTLEDYWLAFAMFLKFRSDKAVFTSANIMAFIEYFKSLFTQEEMEVQSMEGLFSTVSGMLGTLDELKKSPLFAKLYKLALYAMTFSVFEKLGLTFNLFNFSKFEEAAIREEMNGSPTFVITMIRSLIFVCERGYQCLMTGSFEPIFHSGSSYEKWYNDAMELKRRAKLLVCPEAHGFTEFDFRMELDSHIAKGQSINKHAVRMNSYERKMINSVLNDLIMIRDENTTKRAAQKERKAPFSVLLYGGSSIGKTTLTDMLFLQYGKIFNLPTESEYKYTRNPNAEFWDGFTTAQWFVIMDDVAFMNPTIASAGGDPTVMETIQTNNRVAFVPNQASLEDKGRTPFKARCIVATTNCEHLNAHSYFQTPLAMQRRFPFIIDAKVKDIYAKDTCMLDSSVAKMEHGQWPNWWDFEIKRPVPVPGERHGQRAVIETVCTFDDVNDFLAWFSREAKKHDRIQDIIEASSNKMSDYEVCQECFYLIDKCKCFDVQSKIWSGAMRLVKKATATTLIGAMQTRAFTQMMRQPGVVRAITSAIVNDEPVQINDEDFDENQTSSWSQRFKALGDKIQQHIGYPELLGLTVLACTTILASYKCYKYLDAMLSSPLEGTVQTSVNIGRKPVATNDEKPNVWFKDTYEVSSYDVSQKAMSLVNKTRDDIVTMLKTNVICIVANFQRDGQNLFQEGRALCIGGHIYVTNNHNLACDGEIQLRIITHKVSNGVSENIITKLTQASINRLPNSDLCYFTLDCLPARRDLSDLFISERNKSVMKGFMLGRDKMGNVTVNHLDNITKQGGIKVSHVHISEHWLCFPKTPTIVGECGAVYIAETPMGPQILGLHVLGNDINSASTVLTIEMVQKIRSKFDRPIVEPAAPLISSESAPRSLTDLSQKSPFRYLEAGTAAVYGSFEGFRVTHKSNVRPTCIQKAVLEEGYEIKHGAPVMRGWQPWRVAAQDMVSPVTQLDEDLIKQCTQSFYNDIMAGISEESLKEVHVYDDKTALNGAPGVAYVDKMNRNTSMGAPWNKGKKNFLIELPADDEYQNAVEFTPEIKERINTIIAGYEQGHRYMPVFKGQLKDEALPFRKIVAGKTRVFTGAPGDWSFVVRKYLLSVIRLIQNNRFVFETAVGVNATSTQWGALREYLTQFGEDNMIAGDYGRFDKTMPPCIILAAYDIIRSICKAAGYSDKELLVVQCIAEDTAYPMVDFNGDLAQFYGSNPSGHPLTVIVNSLANSLYMRYCYAKLSPDKSCFNFKRDVALMTYGDDNVMGVSKNAPFFNHTMIQNTLALSGITYTMADKEAESIPYIHISQISFLKRFWVWDSDVGAYLAPLEEASISKSLTMGVASKTLCAEAQAIAIMTSAQSEYFMYGKDVFEDKTNMLKRIARKSNIEMYIKDNTFPSWDELKSRFWQNSQN